MNYSGDPGFDDEVVADRDREREIKRAQERIAEIDKTLASDITNAYSNDYLTCAAVLSELDPQTFERLKKNLKNRGVSVSTWSSRVKEIVRKRTEALNSPW
jgi:hypothetical protein